MPASICVRYVRLWTKSGSTTENAEIVSISNTVREDAGALAIVLTGDKLGADPSKCVFFGQGYYEKTVRALREYENYTEIAYNPGTDI